MSLASTLSKIKITDNTIDINILSGGTYGYTSMMSLGGSAIVSDNVLSGCIGTSTISTDLVLITSGSSRITGNYFIRSAGSPVNSYINVSSGSDQIITDNVFDQPTTDGTNEILVTGITNTSLYERNKNQTQYKTLALADFTHNPDPTLGLDIILFGQSLSVDNIFAIQPNPPVTYEPNIQIEHTAFFLGQKQVAFAMNLGNVLPNGVKILTLKMGFRIDGSGPPVLLGNNRIIMTLGTRDSYANFTVGTNSILDVGNNTLTIANVMNDYSGGVPVGVQYLTLDVSGNSAYETLNRTFHILLQIHSRISSGQLVYYLSPVVVKYRW